MLQDSPQPGEVLYAHHRTDSENGFVTVVKRIKAKVVWFRLTETAFEWWVGLGEGTTFEPHELFATKEEADAALR